jgi:hypothetical protein
MNISGEKSTIPIKCPGKQTRTVQTSNAGHADFLLFECCYYWYPDEKEEIELWLYWIKRSVLILPIQ